MTTLSTTETAKILGVSGATIRNWARAGYLAPVDGRPLSFRQEDILALQERIRTNRFNRLRKRATRSETAILETPGIRDAEITATLGKIISYVKTHNIDPAKAVFGTALYYLAAEGEADFPRDGSNFDFARVEWKRPAVQDVMRGWLERIGGAIVPAPPGLLDSFLGWENCEDRLGLLYQGLSRESGKSHVGAHFTPHPVIDASLAELEEPPVSFLDPCCGTGRYLVRVAARFSMEPRRLHGFDSDPAAVDIARINLLLIYRDLEDVPNVRCLDSLRDLATGQDTCDTNHLLESIDVIATIPPWDNCKNAARHKNLTALLKPGESLSHFIEKSLRLLRPGGRLSFILPEAVLKIKAHAELRRLLLRETSIRKIVILGEVFSGVFTPIVRLDLIKKPAPDDWLVEVFHEGNVHHAPQSRFAGNINHAFDAAVTPHDEKLLDKIFAVKHVTLRGNADWALGIVTGDNRNYVLEARAEGTEPVLRGRDIYKFAAREPRSHIVFEPMRFQQVAPEHLYRAPEKLIYRFMSDHLVFAYDDKGTLTLNSANILIPRLPGYSIKSTLAFLNSRVFQYVFTKRFRTRKVLRGDLELLPFPVLNEAVHREIASRVDHCLSGDYKPAEELDLLVCRIFGLDRTDVRMLDARLEDELKRPAP